MWSSLKQVLFEHLMYEFRRKSRCLPMSMFIDLLTDNYNHFLNYIANFYFSSEYDDEGGNAIITDQHMALPGRVTEQRPE